MMPIWGGGGGIVYYCGKRPLFGARSLSEIKKCTDTTARKGVT